MPIDDDLDDDSLVHWMQELQPASGTSDPRIAFYEMGYAAARASTQPAPAIRRRFAAAVMLAAASVGAFLVGRWTGPPELGDNRQMAVVDVAKAPTEPNSSPESDDAPTVVAPNLPRQPHTSPSRLSISILDAPGFELTATGPRSQPDRRPDQPTPQDLAPMLRASDIFQPTPSLLN